MLVAAEVNLFTPLSEAVFEESYDKGGRQLTPAVLLTQVIELLRIFDDAGDGRLQLRDAVLAVT